MPLGLATENSSEVFGPTPPRVCIKCPEAAQAVVNKKDAYCRQCFLLMVRHNFRGALGRKRIFGQNVSDVLVGFDGGSTATAMVALIQDGLRGQIQRRLQIRPLIVTVLTPIVLNPCLQHMRDALFSYLKKSNLDWIVVTLAEVFNENVQHIPTYSSAAPFELDPENHNKLQLLFDAIKSPTSKTELESRLKTALIYRVALKLGIDKVMVGTTSTTLSKLVLARISMARGAQISTDSALVDKRHQKVDFIRPLRELSDKEVALFNHFEKLNPPFTMEVKSESSSIQSVTADFIDGLAAAGFSDTVTTVMSSASKVQGWVDAKKEPSVDYELKCRLCFSDLLGEEKFCYGCGMLLGEIEDKKLLPSWLQ